MMLLFLFLLGLSVGSFANALVWRLHTKQNFTTDRSKCDFCKHTLAWYDLVPLVSWALLKGRCRYCHKSMGYQYPLSELMTGLLFAGSYLVWPHGFDSKGEVLLAFWLVQLIFLVALFIYDLRFMLLPNKLVFPLIAVVVAQTAYEALVVTQSARPVIDAVWGVLAGAGFFYALYVLSRTKWIGGGDVKLAIYFGILLGPQRTLLAIFLASLAGSLISLSLLATRRLKRQQQVPFGPYLILGLTIAYLFGGTIIDWYVDFVTL